MGLLRQNIIRLSLILAALIAANAQAGQDPEERAKGAVLEFVFTVANNADGINTEDNWKSLREEIINIASPAVADTLMDENKFYESLLKISFIKNAAPLLARLGRSDMKIVYSFEQAGQYTYKVKPYESDLQPEYTVVCAEESVRKWYGLTRMETVCEVEDIQFSEDNQ